VPQGPEPKKKHGAEPKPFYTSPPKKGTAGLPGTTFSPHPEHAPEPYKDPLAVSRGTPATKPIGGPIKVGITGSDTFDHNACFTPAGKPSPPIKTKPEHFSTPFRPSSPPRESFSPYPPHAASPYDVEAKARTNFGRTTQSIEGKAPIRPSGVSRSGPTRSIAFNPRLGSTL
jgi:hypothetical protein